jgi:hypothetical protein
MATKVQNCQERTQQAKFSAKTVQVESSHSTEPQIAQHVQLATTALPIAKTECLRHVSLASISLQQGRPIV